MKNKNTLSEDKINEYKGEPFLSDTWIENELNKTSFKDYKGGHIFNGAKWMAEKLSSMGMLKCSTTLKQVTVEIDEDKINELAEKAYGSPKVEQTTDLESILYNGYMSGYKDGIKEGLSLKSDCKVSEEEIEPDGWIYKNTFFKTLSDIGLWELNSVKPVYFSPQPKEVKEVTEDEIENINDKFVCDLLARLNGLGVDTGNWDGEEGLLETLAISIANHIEEVKTFNTNEKLHSLIHDISHEIEIGNTDKAKQLLKDADTFLHEIIEEGNKSISQ